MANVPSSHIHNLPRPLTPLIGREREIDAVAALLQKPGVRLVTLTGPGGVGKTRLAIAVAECLQHAFRDGVVFVALQSLANPELVPSAIAQMLGVREGGSQALTQRLVERLREQRGLLVVDNFEHLLPATAVIGALLAACPELAVLTTSRTVLQLYGEHTYLVPPLTIPDAVTASDVEQLGDIASVHLFLERATASMTNFRLTQENAADVAAICARVEGLPLAIELLAARVKVLGPAELLRRLDPAIGSGPLALLTGGPRDVPERHQTMRDTIQWSYNLLTPEEQRLFRQLSVFAGSWSVEGAEAIAAHAHVLETLSSLVDNSLLQRTDPCGQLARYRLLEPVREFAPQRLAAHEGEAAAARRRHALYFLAVAEDLCARLDDSDTVLWLERLETEHDNLRAAGPVRTYSRWSVAMGG